MLRLLHSRSRPSLARALPAVAGRLFAVPRRTMCDEIMASPMVVGSKEAHVSNPVLNEAIRLLLTQENQGVAADATQDALMQSILLNDRLRDAMIRYFEMHKDKVESQNAAHATAGSGKPDRAAVSEAYSTLIYACIKLRKIDQAFGHYETMQQRKLRPDARVFSSLLKGCGRARQTKRGEVFFRSLAQNKEARHATVYNALINMHSHQSERPYQLLPHQALGSWRAFNEMIADGVMPDEVTYNSLISLCARMRSPDVKRAEMVLEEMMAVGVVPTHVTVSALIQVYGRADALSRGRARLEELIARGVPADATAWRPLLHLAANRADVETTVSLLGEMRSRTSKDVFDTFKLKPCFTENYLMLATGHASGFEAAMELFATARAAGRTDPLTYNFLIEVALGAERGMRTRSSARLANANRAWELMEADGMRPSMALCHRMFGIWAQAGELGRAEAAFGTMREASSELLRASASLATAWEAAADGGGDLETVARSLAGNPMLALGHSFISYVKIVEACVDAAAPPDRVAFYLETLRHEASEREVPVPPSVSEALLCTLAGAPSARHREGRGSERAPPPVNLALLDLARAFHLSLAEGGARPPPAGTVAVVSALLGAGQLEAAAAALLAAGDLSPGARDDGGWTAPATLWSFGVLQQKYDVMLKQAARMEEGEAKQRVAAMLQRASGVFAEEQPVRVTPTPVAQDASQETPQETQPPNEEARPAHAAAPPPPPPVAAVPLPPPPPATTVAAVPPPPPPVAAAEAPVPTAADAGCPAERVEPAPPVEAAIEAAAEAPPVAKDPFAAAAAASRLPEPSAVAEPASSELERRLAAAEADDDFEQAAEIQAALERMVAAHAGAPSAEAAAETAEATAEAASASAALRAEDVELCVEPQLERVQGEAQAEHQAGDGTGPAGVEAPVASALEELQRRLAAAEDNDDFESAMELQKEIEQLET